MAVFMINVPKITSPLLSAPLSARLSTILPAVLSALLLALLLAGCGTVRRGSGPPGQGGQVGGGNGPAGGAVSPIAEMRASLEQAHRDWRGTPYVLGGASKSGVDCSRFVNIVFDRYFGVELPTNTRTQLNAGSGIPRNALRSADLVFFRTGRQTLHVGIIVEGDDFLHASTSQGVMISSLSESYWSSRYLAARRVM